jgi:hypothetical protein
MLLHPEKMEDLKLNLDFRLQAAMEYLMTYGWAILIVSLAVGVLYSLGILNPEALKPQICSLSAPFYCSDQYLDTNGFLTLTIAQGSGSSITINKIACVDKSLLSNGLPLNPSYWSSVGVSIPSGSQRQISNIICYSSGGKQYNGKIGSVFSGAIVINATTSTNVNFLSLGDIGAPVKALSALRASGWSYRKPITIDNTKNANTLSNYQVSVTLDTASLISAGKLRSDCGDIRFTDSDGQTLLSYWIESGCNSANTKIWVKVPSIPASSTKTIYVYYGNPSATSQSNGYSTFDFFDDFSSYPVGSNLNGQGGWVWQAYNPSSQAVIISFNGKNYLKLYAYQYANNVKHPVNIPNSVRVVSRAYYYSGDQAYSFYLFDGSTYTTYMEPGNSYYWMMESGATHYDLCKFLGTSKYCLCQSYIDSPQGHYYRLELIWNGSSLNGFSYQDGTLFTTCSAVDTSFSSRPYIALTNWEWSGAGSASTYYVDYVFISKYSYPEPTTSVGAEQSI